MKTTLHNFIAAGAALLAVETALTAAEPRSQPERRLLYVAVPGIRDYLEYGGHGVLVFDIDQGHKFVKRIGIGQRFTSR